MDLSVIFVSYIFHFIQIFTVIIEFIEFIVAYLFVYVMFTFPYNKFICTCCSTIKIFLIIFTCLVNIHRHMGVTIQSEKMNDK